jgi:hypothetical protein
MKKKIFLLMFTLVCFVMGFLIVRDVVAEEAMTYTITGTPTGDWWSGQTPQFDPAWAWAKEVEDFIEGAEGIDSWYFTPTDTEPTSTEGRVYYDDSDNTLRLYDGSNWVNMDTAGASSLGSAYSAGAKIDADTTAVEIEVADGSNNVALLIDHDENTNDNTALHITNASDSGYSIHIDGTTSSTDIYADNWSITNAGLITYVGGENTGDMTHNGANYDIEFDVSADALHFEDNAVLSIGGADNAAGDFTFTYDATDLLIEAAAANDDWKMGATTNFDVTIYGGTATNYWKFDTDDAALLMIFEGVDARFSDSDELQFGDSDDITMAFDGSGGDLDITGAGLEIAFGASGDAPDIYIHSETAGDNVFFDEDNSEALFTDYDIQLDDSALLIFGTGDDWTVYSDTADTLEFDPGAAGDQLKIGTANTDAVDLTWYSDISGAILFLDEESATVNLGANDTGLDVVFFGDTASQKAWWDCSGDEWFFGADAEGVDVTFYGDTASSYAKWDENSGTNGVPFLL